MSDTADVLRCPLMTKKAMRFCAQALTANAHGEYVNGIPGVTISLIDKNPGGGLAAQVVETKVTDGAGVCEFALKIESKNMARYAMRCGQPPNGPYRFDGGANVGPKLVNPKVAYFYQAKFSLAKTARLTAPPFATVPLGQSPAAVDVTISNVDTATMKVLNASITAGGACFRIPGPRAWPISIQPGGSATLQIAATPDISTALCPGQLGVLTEKHGLVTVALECSAYAVTGFAVNPSPLPPGAAGAGFQYRIEDPKGALAEAKIELEAVLSQGKPPTILHTINNAPFAHGVQNAAWAGQTTHPVSHPDGFVRLHRSPYTARITASKAGGVAPFSPPALAVPIAQTGEVMVTIERHDGAAFQARTSIDITGIAPVVALVNHATVAAAGPHRELCLIQGLAAGDYELQLAGGLLAAEGLARLAPAQNGRLRIKVVAGQRTKASYQLSPYTAMQFIGAHMKPRADNRANPLAAATYFGETDPFHDMIARVQVTIEAMRAAQAHGQIVPNAHVLKVFMMPEFYFRGAAGGYPLEVVEEILPRLQQEAQSPNYANWLFVYGTAIGFLRHEDTAADRFALEVSNVGAPNSGGANGLRRIDVIRRQAVPPPNTTWPVTDVCKRIPQHLQVAPWQLAGAGGWSASIWTTNRTGANSFQLNVYNEAGGLPAVGDVELVKSPVSANVYGLEISVVGLPNSGTAPGTRRITVIRRQAAPLPGESHPTTDICKQIPQRANAGAAWELDGLGQHAKIWETTRVDANTFHLDVYQELGGALQVGEVLLIEPQVNEVFNVALVQVGGATPGGPRERMVYKEYISSVDFVGPHGGNSNLWGPNRMADVDGQRDRVLTPTAGSVDSLAASSNPAVANAVSEQNSSGLGGGSLFTISGVNVGLEVCLDHLMARLWKYSAARTPGDSIPQALLIPSMGMDIEMGPSYGAANALLFNVDGRAPPQFAPEAGTLTASRCIDHAHAGNAFAAPNTACALPHYECTAHRGNAAGPGVCSRCNAAMVPYYICSNHYSPTPACTCGAGGLAATHTFCRWHGIGNGIAGAACGVGGCAIVLQARHLCLAQHFWVEDPLCHCGSLAPLAPQADRKCPKQHAITAHALGNCPSCAAPMTLVQGQVPGQRTIGTVFAPAAKLAAPAAANAHYAYAVNDQTRVTEITTTDVNTGVSTVNTAVHPLDAPPLKVPGGAPHIAPVIANPGANQRVVTTVWRTNSLAGHLDFTQVVDTTDVTVNNVRTVTRVTTVTRAGNLAVEPERLLTEPTKLHIFATANLPNATIA